MLLFVHSNPFSFPLGILLRASFVAAVLDYLAGRRPGPKTPRVAERWFYQSARSIRVKTHPKP